MNSNPETLLELLSEYSIEIPVVQRDYAQGRIDDDASMVRNILLSDMKAAILRETAPLNLNFVYGKDEGSKFIPIDGQQRLTTLFLLHLYAFCDDDSKTELLNRFSYRTRTSSRRFLECLVENRAGVFSSEQAPSEEIMDSEWFASNWKYDPTVQSVFVMLDEMHTVYSDVNNLAARLTDDEYKPIVFKFLEMKNLGMEDSLYIKLNARGKPLSHFENFKARLIGRLADVLPDLFVQFENRFDVAWSDLFWSKGHSRFDQTYLDFFGILLMNSGILRSDTNWANTFDFSRIQERDFKTAFYTLDYLCNNPEKKIVHDFIFTPLLEDRRTYPQRVLFHAVTTFLYNSEGTDDESFVDWLRVIKNLTANHRIDEFDKAYRPAIEGINKIADCWDCLLDYLAKDGAISGFNQEQVKEEQQKAKIIIADKDFATAIYEAEKHQYFTGQVRSALYYAVEKDTFDLTVFETIWSKISVLFSATRPIHGHTLRRALLALGDYTIPVSDYRTLCVDDPNEGERTPSMKQLFSSRSKIVKLLLDSLSLDDDIDAQLKQVIQSSNIPQIDWRYCFIKLPSLFKSDTMSAAHLRLRNVSGEWIIVRHKASNGYNEGLYEAALCKILAQKNIESWCEGDVGTWADRYLVVDEYRIRYKKGSFVVSDTENGIVHNTTTDKPFSETVNFLASVLTPNNKQDGGKL